MGAVRVCVECAQCGRGAPPDGVEMLGWRGSALALDGDLDDVTAAMVLCPDCQAEDRRGDYDQGEAG